MYRIEQIERISDRYVEEIAHYCCKNVNLKRKDTYYCNVSSFSLKFLFQNCKQKLIFENYKTDTHCIIFLNGENGFSNIEIIRKVRSAVILQKFCIPNNETV